MTATLEGRNITVRYGGTLALDDVSIQLRPGTVHALIGENGAGKSTLVKVLAGIVRPTGGRILMKGAEVALRSSRDADALGIGIIHQELNLCPNLNVAENIFLGRELAPVGWVDQAGQAARTRELLARLEHPIDPAALVGQLPLGQQQIIEIARALLRDVQVLMMDEPTSALSPPEIAVLFRVIRELRAQGVAIVYISHRLRELLAISDHVSVLRDGRLIAEAPAADVDTGWIVERMTGRAPGGTHAVAETAAGRELLRVEGMNYTAASGQQLLRDVSLQVRAGEVLGIYGLMGAGRTELLECVMGLHPEATGDVVLNGKPASGATTAERIAAGLAMAPEDRKVSGFVHTLSVRSNITLAGISRFSRAGWLQPEGEEAAAAGMAKDLRIKSPGLGSNIGELSGGNQQKVVIAKCLITAPRVLLLDEPSRGVDVGAKAEIHAIVRRLAMGGMGVVVVSSELEEVRAVADRVLVMSRGMVVAEFSAGEATDEALALAAGGGVTA